ncbi:MAG TPA: formate acetyltransferase [Chloroflexi bacterium]|jgi:pyruvate-formate lyase|nr:formate acetyltransferase [Chloroflexota bacterium]
MATVERNRVRDTERVLTYEERYDALRETKLAQTLEKQRVIGAMDHDDWGQILPPEDQRQIVQSISGSGMPITDVLLKDFAITPNHPSGGFFGPKAVGENFRGLMEAHPVYVDPLGSLAGAYMVNFSSYIEVHQPPELGFGDLPARVRQYDLVAPFFGQQHFCQDMAIGLELGYGGLLLKIRTYRRQHGADKQDFYDGLEAVVLGLQNWIGRTAEAARAMAAKEEHPQLRRNLEEMAEMNAWLVDHPPRTFREACQWILWYLIMARMYNGSGSCGRLDVLLTPFYERDVAAGILTDEEAAFHVANLLLRDTTYLQLGGPDASGQDVTNRVSYLILEAAHKMCIATNVGVSVGPGVDPGLLRRGVEIQFEDKAGTPKFLGIHNIVEGFARNDIPLETARLRAYAGCHWFALPGREYCLNDCAKINLAKVFEVAFNDYMAAPRAARSVADLWEHYVAHLRSAVATMAEVFDFHVQHKHEVFPELALDLCCYGPIEKGLDASAGGVEYYNFGIDAAALATTADSFAAIEQRVEREGRLSWEELHAHLQADWAGAEGERARLMMRNIPRYGSGGSRADAWAVRLTETFVDLVKEKPTPDGYNMIPGHFSWANTIPMGKNLGATPNGRHAGAPISHGANPDPGFRQDGAPSAMAAAIAGVQCGYGNSSPMQLELDPGLGKDEGGVDTVADLIRTHMDLGGTQINLNVMDAAKVLAAHEDPSKYPDLIVRVTGFSAYFASLSPEFRQLVVDRIIAEG